MLNTTDPDYRKTLQILGEPDTDQFNALIQNRGVEFFCPDPDMIKWLANYVGDRFLFEIGCGSGRVLRMLDHYAPNLKIVGMEPMWDVTHEFTTAMAHNIKPLQILPYSVQDHPSMITGLTKAPTGTVLLFCRPCHGEFVELAVDAAASGTTVMYITLEKNLTKYQDLGKYQHLLELVPHEGGSTDDEKVYVFVKP